MKKAIALVLALCMCCALLLTACGGSKVRDDVAPADVAAAVSKALGMENDLVSLDGTFLGLTGKSADAVGEHAILVVANGTSIDEIGVFKAGAMTVDELKALAGDYLDLYAEKTWPMVELYNPDEKPKLTGAEVKVLGNYVMYAILSETDRKTASDAFENALK